MFRNLQSTGHLAVNLRIPVAVLDRRINELEIEPDCVLNGVRYFDAAACKRVADEIVDGTRVRVVNAER
ncbi:MAG: hypothetical protein GXX96_30460 [Planctomycetaceae bacterium]|jgi:hypothetical protein|nr:hypothetical protein [Planctomycetaceae bacterium]